MEMLSEWFPCCVFFTHEYDLANALNAEGAESLARSDLPPICYLLTFYCYNFFRQIRFVSITGFPDPSVVVNESPGQETVDEVAIQRLKDATRTVSSELGNKEPHTAQCCYLPSTSDGVPIIGPIPSVNGAFVAAGHSCWGILNGPATGEAMAELVTDGKTTHVNLDAFSLKRFASSQIVGR